MCAVGICFLVRKSCSVCEERIFTFINAKNLKKQTANKIYPDLFTPIIEINHKNNSVRVPSGQGSSAFSPEFKIDKDGFKIPLSKRKNSFKNK